MLFRLLAPIVGNAFGLWLAADWIPWLRDQVNFTGPIYMLLVAAVILGFLNFIIKPLIKLLALPLIILSAGLFSIIINTGILWMADFLLEELTIQSPLALLATSLLLSVVHILI